MALSYPDIVDDILNGRPLKNRRICRTCTDCNIAPNSTFPSGCYSLDEFFKKRPEHTKLKEIKAQMKAGLLTQDPTKVQRRL